MVLIGGFKNNFLAVGKLTMLEVLNHKFVHKMVDDFWMLLFYHPRGGKETSRPNLKPPQPNGLLV